MKHFPLLFLLLCPFLSVYGQSPITPLHKANTIIIQTPDSATMALRKLATAFVAQGYTVDKLDAQFYTLLMAPKAMDNTYHPVLTIRATAQPGGNSLVKLMADYKVDYGNTHFSAKAEYAGSESGNNKTAFREMQQAARAAYPNGQISYGKQ